MLLFDNFEQILWKLRAFSIVEHSGRTRVLLIRMSACYIAKILNPLFTSYDYSPTIFDRYLDCRHILLLIEVSNISNSFLEKKLSPNFVCCDA